MKRAGIPVKLEEDIMTASRVMVNILAESLMSVGEEHITVPQFRALDMISTLTDKPTEIARMLDISPPSVSFLLEKLEEKGLIERRFSTSDRRRTVLALTVRGVDVVKRVNDHRENHLKRILENMDEESRSRLVQALEAFTDSYFQLKTSEADKRNA